MRATVAAADAVVRLHLRCAGRGAAAWASLFAGVVAASALAYGSAFPGAAQRTGLQATLGADQGLQSLFGIARHVDTMPGFVGWRATVLVSTIAAAWAGLTSARLVRGAEADEQAELLAAGRVPRWALVALAIAAVDLLLVAIGGAIAAAGIGGGLRPGPAILWGMALMGPAAAFAGLGALTGRFAPSRHAASTICALAVGLAFAVRVTGDATPSLRIVGAFSPLTWVERQTALVDLHAGWLALMAGVVVLLSVAAPAIATRWDAASLGAGGTRRRRAAARRLGLVGAWGSIGWWAPAIMVFSVMTGLLSASVAAVARTGGRTLSSNGAFGELLTPRGYLTTTLLLISAAVATHVAGAAARARDEEASGRLDLVLAGPGGRAGWLAPRMARGVLAGMGLMLLAGGASWAGARARGVPLTAPDLLGAGLAAVPQVVALLGLAVLSFGVAPRITPAVASGGAGALLMLQLVGEALGAPSWVTSVSPFAHAATAPLHPVRLGPAVTMTAVGIALGAAGVAAFLRRDVGR